MLKTPYSRYCYNTDCLVQLHDTRSYVGINVTRYTIYSHRFRHQFNFAKTPTFYGFPIGGCSHSGMSVAPACGGYGEDSAPVVPPPQLYGGYTAQSACCTQAASGEALPSEITFEFPI